MVLIHSAGAIGRLHLPDAAHPAKLVLLFPDAAGLRDAVDAQAQRFTAAGFAVLAVDPYAHEPPFEPFDPSTMFVVPEERARAMKLITGVSPERVFADASALVEVAARDSRIDASRLGAVGYCMGGRLAFLLAAAWGERVAAAAPIHAGGLVTTGDASPHLRAPAISAELYFGVADADAGCTPEHQAALSAALDAANVRYTLEVYEGKKHGFASPDFPVFDAEAYDQHVARVTALFERTLGGAG